MNDDGNSMFDGVVERRATSNAIHPEEEEKYSYVGPDLQEKLDFLGISPQGFQIRQPTKWNDNPQQILKTFENTGITFSSMFDSGNLLEVTEAGDHSYDLFISSDSQPYTDKLLYRAWFYFSITGLKQGNSITFTIRNMKNLSKLYTAGMRPVFMTTSADGSKVIIPWRRIFDKPSFTWNEREEVFTLNWTFGASCSSEEVVYFAYSYPYSFEQITSKLDEFEASMTARKNVYFHRETLTYSREGRKQEMVTVTSLEGINEDGIGEEHIDGLFPEATGYPEDRPLRFFDK